MNDPTPRLLVPQPRRRQGALIGGFLAAGLTTLAVGGVFSALRDTQAAPTAEEVATLFCTQVALGAQVSPEVLASKEVSVLVPSSQPPYDMARTALAVQKGDVVEVAVRSTTDGAIGVHGLSRIIAIHSGGSVAVRFRAIYAGRFALHFHGTDGAHYELMAIEVNMGDGSSAPP